MRKNILREKLTNDEPTISTHIHSVWPSIVEAIGHAHIYDYVEFVAEYGPSDLHDLDNLSRAADIYGLGMMLKVDQSNQAYLAQRGIGSGFESILFTDARSIDDVKECIKIATPDTPEDGGLYGVSTRRNSYMGYGGSEEYAQSVRDIVIAIMIEKQGAVDCLEEILSLPNVDMIQWGPADFSMNTGKYGQRNHPDIINTRNYVFKKAIEMGVAPRAEINSVEDAKEYLDMGVKHFSLGTDISILHNWWKQNGELLAKAIQDA
jgi:2-keto-3-deoxy-L-rhamnonate aldolase RhmA